MSVVGQEYHQEVRLKSDCSQRILKFSAGKWSQHWAFLLLWFIKAFWKLPQRKKICRTWWTHEKTAEYLQKKMLAKGSEISKLFSWAYRVLCHRRAWGRVVCGGRRNQFNRDKNYELSGNGNGGGMNVSIFSVSRIRQMSWYLKKLVKRCFKDFLPPSFQKMFWQCP